MREAEVDRTGKPRLRRANRADIPALLDDVGGPPAGRLRSLRRLLKTLVADVYVLEHAATILGVVSVTYRRSLTHGGLVATIDLLRARAEAGPGGTESCAEVLVGCAIERARRRGCVAIDTLIADPAADAAFERAGLVEVARQRLLSLRSSSSAPAANDDAGARGEA